MEDKKILLISNEVLHYREKIYNYFHERFLQDGFDFQVASNSFQEVGIPLQFKAHTISFNSREYISFLKKEKPDCVILFLHLKDTIMIPVILYCKTHHIPVIYWNHGINIKDPDNKAKNAIFNMIHDWCDALITYTPDMKKYFSVKNQKKLFVAYNTLNFTDINKDLLPSKEETKDKYGIKQEIILLYASRILEYKKPDLLIKLFKSNEKIAVVFVGPGISEEMKATIKEYDNLYYLGEKYGSEVDAIYKASDIFSTPGHIGLAMNQALFWGLPVVVLKGIHAPEIYYMKDGITGFICSTEDELKKRVFEIAYDEKLRSKMHQACLDTYEKEVSIERMYDGFKDAIDYVKC